MEKDCFPIAAFIFMFFITFFLLSYFSFLASKLFLKEQKSVALGRCHQYLHFLCKGQMSCKQVQYNLLTTP